jgi:prepilin-type N-terminal cleavage/methylation domain-containing protein
MKFRLTAILHSPLCPLCGERVRVKSVAAQRRSLYPVGSLCEAARATTRVRPGSESPGYRNVTQGDCHWAFNRRAFTLTELLVVIAIMSILFAMTISVVNFSLGSEKASGAALQLQSFLNGARDRAIYHKEPRGVRFFIDPINHRSVTSMVYTDPAEYWDSGVIQLQRPDFDLDGVADNASVRVAAGVGSAWWELKRRGLLFDGLRMRIPKGPRGTWYQVSTRLIDITVAPQVTQYLVLGIPYADPGDTPTDQVQAFQSGGPNDYELELPPRILPMDPVLLPENTVVDLDASKIPQYWRPSSTAGTTSSGNLQYSSFIDIVFSPRGNVIGGASSAGVIHFYIGNNDDAITLKDEFIASLPASPLAPGDPATMPISVGGKNLNTGQVRSFNSGIAATPFIPADVVLNSADGGPTWNDAASDTGSPYIVRDRRIVTLMTQTGAVSVHQINPTDTNSDGLADDPFLFAETGETAN